MTSKDNADDANTTGVIVVHETTASESSDEDEQYVTVNANDSDDDNDVDEDADSAHEGSASASTGAVENDNAVDAASKPEARSSSRIWSSIPGLSQYFTGLNKSNSDSTITRKDTEVAENDNNEGESTVKNSESGIDDNTADDTSNAHGNSDDQEASAPLEILDEEGNNSVIIHNGASSDDTSADVSDGEVGNVETDKVAAFHPESDSDEANAVGFHH
ncbi:unnamed protein product [Ambrosiozyma monospora]|uniref:Unnamed protein product n=1 Tax=Ambrosiozyma monospora TaxID=43982 RepID=A0ACB5U2Z7_AMBMO|nr:unnamed protein product [Ambrosiozyma monospora]